MVGERFPGGMNSTSVGVFPEGWGDYDWEL